MDINIHTWISVYILGNVQLFESHVRTHNVYNVATCTSVDLSRNEKRFSKIQENFYEFTRKIDDSAVVYSQLFFHPEMHISPIAIFCFFFDS